MHQPIHAMKTLIATLLVTMIAGARAAFAYDIFPPITTTDGQTYDHITAQRTDPDGLYVEYTLPGGGMGAAKVKFSRLSARLRKQCGYSSWAARDYEDATAEGARAYQAWADQEDVARQRAQAEAYAYQVEQAAMIARQAPAPGQAVSAPKPGQSVLYGSGWSQVSPNPFDTLTTSTFQGILPQDRLTGPSGFSQEKIQLLPGTPNFTRNFSMPPARAR
jgi:hypothetical protein